jgi:hypothetical protein
MYVYIHISLYFYIYIYVYINTHIGDYDRPYDPLESPKYIRNKPSAIFQTVGDRHSFMDSEGMRSESPGPGTYINADNKPDKASSDFAHHWSKTNLERFSVIDEGTPGPTHYFQGPPSPTSLDDDSMMHNSNSRISYNSSTCVSPNSRRSAGIYMLIIRTVRTYLSITNRSFLHSHALFLC